MFLVYSAVIYTSYKRVNAKKKKSQILAKKHLLNSWHYS